MSKRKDIRNLIRAKAEQIGAKPSKYLAENFDKYQRQKYGSIARTINKCKSTKKRKTWKARIIAATT